MFHYQFNPFTIGDKITSHIFPSLSNTLPTAQVTEDNCDCWTDIGGLTKITINLNQKSVALDLEFYKYSAVHNSAATFGGICVN